MADAYLAGHLALIADAKVTVLRWEAEGMFGTRGSIRPHRAKLNTSEQRGGQPVAGTSIERNSCTQGTNQ